MTNKKKSIIYFVIASIFLHILEFMFINATGLDYTTRYVIIKMLQINGVVGIAILAVLLAAMGVKCWEKKDD